MRLLDRCFFIYDHHKGGYLMILKPYCLEYEGSFIFFDTFEEADQHASELIASDSLPKAALIWEGG